MEKLSADSIIEKFIITTNSIAKGFINYIVNRNQKKTMFRMFPQNLLPSKGKTYKI